METKDNNLTPQQERLAHVIGRILESALAEALTNVKEKSTLLTEMAIPLKEYSDRFFNLRIQIVQNWVLCKYCQLFNPDNDNRRRWMRELRTHIDKLKYTEIKGGKDKTKILKRLAYDYDLRDQKMIYGIIYGKIVWDEGITNNEQLKTLCQEFVHGVDSLLSVIASDYTYPTDEYLDITFGDC